MFNIVVNYLLFTRQSQFEYALSVSLILKLVACIQNSFETPNTKVDINYM